MATKPQLAGGALPPGKGTALLSKSDLTRSQGPGQPSAEVDESALVEHALAHSRSWSLAEHGSRWTSLLRKFRSAKTTFVYGRAGSRSVPADVRNELQPSRVLLYRATLDVEGCLRTENYAPQVEEAGEKLPRAYVAARSYLAATGGEFNDASFLSYMQAIQGVLAFEISEIWLLSPFIQLQLLFELSGEIQK